MKKNKFPMLTIVDFLHNLLFFILTLGHSIASSHLLAAIISFAASITDYLDGYLVVMNVVSNFGKFADPDGRINVGCVSLSC